MKIQAGYIISPYFKDIYLYLAQNKLFSTKCAIWKVEALAEKYILLDVLLLNYYYPRKRNSIAGNTRNCADKIIALYHSSLFAGHQCVIETYLTISNKYFIPNLIHYLRSYIKGCHIGHLACNEKTPARQLQTWINPNYIPLSRLSTDLKVMPKSYRGHRFILYIKDEVTNYLITIPIHQDKYEEVGETLIENIITKYCIAEYIIMDQDSSFMSSLMNYQLHKFDIKIKTVAPYKHQSPQAEHGIKS